MAGAAILFLAVVSGIAQLTAADCDGIPVSLSRRSSRDTVKSPHFPNGEKGQIANCIWDISPPRDGKIYFLKFEIAHMSLTYLNKENERICPGSYNLTVHGKQMDCTLFVNYASASVPCMVFYDSPACERAAERECSRSAATETPFPVRVTYVSDGRSNFDGIILGFKARYEFKECPKEQEPSTTTPSSSPSISTKNEFTSVPELEQRESTTKYGGLSPTSSIIAEDPASSSTTSIIISLIAVIVFLVVGGIIIGGICYYRRIKTPANARGQRQQPISQNIPTNVTNVIPDVAFHNYENIQPPVLIETPVCEVSQLSGMPEEDERGDAIPDVAFHNYEDIQPPVLIETPGYEVPQPIGMPEEDEEGYVVPNMFQQGESSREGEYAEAFQHLKPEPDYIEPETVRKEPNRRLVTKFKIP